MAQMLNSNSLFRLFLELSDNESVYVTHVENPVHFYCRLETDDEQFSLLNNMITKHVELGYHTLPNIDGINVIKFLVFSTIRNCWCRGQFLSFQVNPNLKPTFAKVWLIDYGSIEIVSWKINYVISSTPDIDNFNNGQGYCFPCSLGHIMPYNGQCDYTKTNSEWSSYGNFLFEKETKNRKFLLKLFNMRQKFNTIVCDLVPIHEQDYSDENEDIQHASNSLTKYLVNSNIARYINSNGNNNNNQEHEISDDDEKENVFVTNLA